jgi:hypothetical protein
MSYRIISLTTVLSCLLLLLLPEVAICQDGNGKLQVVVDSRPPGAAVYIEGAFTVVGRTPLKIDRPLYGPYKIRSWKYGFEEYSSELQFTGENENIMIVLRRKTPLKAGVRSLVIPGWGQMYTDQRMKGFLFGAAQLGTVIGSLMSHSSYLEAKDDYNAAVAEFERNQKSYSDRGPLLEEVVRRQRELDKAFDRRRTWLWVAGSVWAFNVLDAIFFFPRDHSKLYDMRLTPISATVDPGVMKVNVTMAF